GRPRTTPRHVRIRVSSTATLPSLNADRQDTWPHAIRVERAGRAINLVLNEAGKAALVDPQHRLRDLRGASQGAGLAEGQVRRRMGRSNVSGVRSPLARPRIRFPLRLDSDPVGPHRSMQAVSTSPSTAEACGEPMTARADERSLPR